MDNKRLYTLYQTKNTDKETKYKLKKTTKILEINNIIQQLNEIMSTDECYDALAETGLYRYNMNNSKWNDEMITKEINNYLQSIGNNNIEYEYIFEDVVNYIRISAKFS